MPTARFLDVFAEDSWRRVYAGEREVRPPGAPTAGSAAAARELLPDQPRGLGEEVIGVTELLNRGSPAVDRCGGCGLGVAMEEGDLRSQHVREACSAFVDVVMATGAAEQFGPRCPTSDLERGRNGRNGVCLWDDEQERDTDGGGASHGSTPGEAEERPRGHAVLPC